MIKKFVVMIGIAVLSVFLSGCDGKADSSSALETSDTASKTEITENTTDTTTTTTEKREETTTPQSEDSTPMPQDSVRQDIVQTANSLIGIPFSMGFASPEEGFDNSGFIYYVLRENGYINCPRSTTAQMEMGTKTEYNDMKAGDVIFFKDETDGEENYFGGIYIGDDTIVYSPYPGENVKTADISISYWQERIYTVVTVI